MGRMRREGEVGRGIKRKGEGGKGEGEGRKGKGAKEEQLQKHYMISAFLM